MEHDLLSLGGLTIELLTVSGILETNGQENIFYPMRTHGKTQPTTQIWKTAQFRPWACKEGSCLTQFVISGFYALWAMADFSTVRVGFIFKIR